MEESPRAHRRLTLSQQSPLCVTWNVGTSVFEPHAERIEALHLEVESGIYYIIHLLVLMAPSKRLHILYIESNHDFPDESYGSTFWAKGPSDGLSALRYLTLDNVTLGWSWPIRNLLFLRLRKLRIGWPELCEVLVSSPDFEILSLNYISMQGWNPTASHHETVVFPVHYNLRTLIISYNTYLAHAGYTTGSILPFIRASNITKLTVFVRGGSTEGLGLGILVSNARESLEDISIGLPTISNLDDALIAITDPPTSAYESLDPNKSTRGHGGRQLSAPYRYQHISGGEL
ncbi:hypothetical protein FRB94_011260 [Tulasnella sp. JGI-2019a]|nr:hypothetical protein FRB94_011260 [Tulasnella sp. JGI-2019a]